MAAPGDVLADRYELLSRLGRGGMAEVFRAHDNRLSREVAVKVLAPHLLSDARSVDRFDREARAAASLNHPNIVNVFDAVSVGDTHAIVMELVEGPTLADVIERDGQMSPDDAIRIANSIADALQAAHDRGLVHHDVKPRNVLFDRDGSLKVTDFGIARAASSDITTVQGSPPYLAPEQARGGRSDRRSDIYALGCVLFEMLAGRPPFEGDSSSAVVMQHIDAPVPRLSDFRPDVSRDLEAVVTRALAKDPDERYDSPAAMRADLTRIASGRSADATIISSTRAMPQDATMALGNDPYDVPPDSTRSYDDPPRRRRGVSARGVAITLAVILLLAVLAIAWADTRGRDTADAAPTISEEPAQDAAEPPPDEPAPDEPAPDDGAQNSIQRRIDQLNRNANRLQRLLERGRAADEATQDRIDELRRELEQAVERTREQSSEAGQDSLDEISRRIDELANNEAIGDNLANQLRDLINRLNPFAEG